MSLHFPSSLTHCKSTQQQQCQDFCRSKGAAVATAERAASLDAAAAEALKPLPESRPLPEFFFQVRLLFIPAIQENGKTPSIILPPDSSQGIPARRMPGCDGRRCMSESRRFNSQAFNLKGLLRLLHKPSSLSLLTKSKRIIYAAGVIPGESERKFASRGAPVLCLRLYLCFANKLPSRVPPLDRMGAPHVRGNGGAPCRKGRAKRFASSENYAKVCTTRKAHLRPLYCQFPLVP